MATSTAGTEAAVCVCRRELYANNSSPRRFRWNLCLGALLNFGRGETEKGRKSDGVEWGKYPSLPSHRHDSTKICSYAGYVKNKERHNSFEIRSTSHRPLRTWFRATWTPSRFSVRSQSLFREWTGNELKSDWDCRLSLEQSDGPQFCNPFVWWSV